jgi:hypothetical protein
MTPARTAGLLALWLSLPAAAWPVDRVVPVEPGREAFVRLSAVDWAEAERPEVAEVEVLPSGELMFTGKAAGETLVLLYAEGRMGVWRVRVGAGVGEPKRDEAAEAKARAACPGLHLAPGAMEEAVKARVKGEACRLTLRELLKGDVYPGPSLSLEFEVPELQAQLRELQAAVDGVTAKGAVKAVYVGAGLKLSGPVTQAQKRAVLWQAFRVSVGRVPLEDRMTVKE